MSTPRFSFGAWRAAIVAVTVAPALAAAQRPDTVTVARWLVLGPVPANAPAFGIATDSALLAASRISVARGWPAAGASLDWLDGRTVAWSERAAAEGMPQLAGSAGSAAVFAAAYLDADRFTRATLLLGGAAHRVVTLDGAPVRGDRIELTRGKHLLLVHAIEPASAPLALTARVILATPGARVEASLDPRHPVTLEELMRTADVRDIAVDPAGRNVAWVTRRIDVPNDKVTGTLEVHDATTGRLLTELSVNADASGPRWSRDGIRLAYTTPTDEKGSTGRDLWVWDAGRSASERLLRGERGLADVQWSPGGDWLYFTATRRAGASESYKAGDLQHLTEVWDRWSFWPDKARLYALNVRDGTRLELAGDSTYSVEGAELSPDGKQMVFARSIRITTRPWLRGEVWVLDLGGLAARKLLDLPREAFGAPTSFAWSPDGKAVAFCASAKETQTAEDPTFSVYETELYATNVERPRLVLLSDGFVPAVACSREIAWNARDQRIYVTADAGARTIPARTAGAVPSSLASHPRLVAMRIPGEVVTAYGFGPDAMVAAVQTATSPSVVYRAPFGDVPSTVLARPSEQSLAPAAAMPSWRPWEFTNSKGTKIEAWYWLPPNFDSTKTYPMIVHYYGGTLPMKKSFDQRLVWFAANGYVVFMLNPAGAPGYGQVFANLHVNDWGYPAGSDIIEGVEQFEKTHAFVDSRHVGNFGHSYGGFMTMHLATRTSLFATSIEIAGISDIANYWGAGWTGYSYTDGTCPGCYPWNRKDVFVDRSPLFSADKIHTPMLLIAGTSDTNVPPSETETMFTALRMLGREAELVRFYGENHGINSRPSVTRHLYGTMLDWYDKQLRGEPEAWAARWTMKPADIASAGATTTTSPRP